MPELELRRIVEGFAKGILSSKSSRDMCAAVTWPLEGYLSVLGYEVKAVQGYIGKREHWWLECADGNIIDATAQQFRANAKLPKVYIGPKPQWYRDVS